MTNAVLYGPHVGKTCLRGFANNKGADQPAHLRSLISTFVVHLLESTISRLATREFSNFLLVSVAEQAGLSLDFSETQKTGFLASRPILRDFVSWTNTSESRFSELLLSPHIPKSYHLLNASQKEQGKFDEFISHDEGLFERNM